MPCRPAQVAVGTWAVVTLGLAAAAVVQGRASMPRLLPDFEAFSGGAAQVCAMEGRAPGARGAYQGLLLMAS